MGLFALPVTTRVSRRLPEKKRKEKLGTRSRSVIGLISEYAMLSYSLPPSVSLPLPPPPCSLAPLFAEDSVTQGADITVCEQGWRDGGRFHDPGKLARHRDAALRAKSLDLGAATPTAKL